VLKPQKSKTNVGSNAEVTLSTNLTIFSLFLRLSQAKSLELDKLVITHVNANQTPKMRRRTYRAHGSCDKRVSEE
jgi:hypothetical protein